MLPPYEPALDVNAPWFNDYEPVWGFTPHRLREQDENKNTRKSYRTSNSFKPEDKIKIRRLQEKINSLESSESALISVKNRQTERIRSLEEQTRISKAENRRLTGMLSKQMHQKLNEDESSFENINTNNRPSKIVEDYNELMTTHWLNAKDVLDEQFPTSKEECRIKFLSHLLMSSYSLALEEFKRYRSHLQNTLMQPIESLHRGPQVVEAGLERMGRIDDFDDNILGTDLRASIISFLKSTSDAVKTDMLALTVSAEIQWNTDSSSSISDAEIQSYVKYCCQLAWRMIVQKPPLEPITPDVGKPPSKDRHDVYYDCPKSSSNVVSSYVYPIVRQGGKSLTKGKVYVVPENDFKVYHGICNLFTCEHT